MFIIGKYVKILCFFRWDFVPLCKLCQWDLPTIWKTDSFKTSSLSLVAVRRIYLKGFASAFLIWTSKINSSWAIYYDLNTMQLSLLDRVHEWSYLSNFTSAQKVWNPSVMEIPSLYIIFFQTSTFDILLAISPQWNVTG